MSVLHDNTSVSARLVFFSSLRNFGSSQISSPIKLFMKFYFKSKLPCCYLWSETYVPCSKCFNAIDVAPKKVIVEEHLGPYQKSIVQFKYCKKLSNIVNDYVIVTLKILKNVFTILQVFICLQMYIVIFSSSFCGGLSSLVLVLFSNIKFITGTAIFWNVTIH